MINSYISGKNIFLRHPSLEDAQGDWYQWLSDPETTKWLAMQNLPNSKDKQIDFYNSLKNDTSRLVLSIVDIESNQHIGVCSLSSINFISRCSDIAVLIGNDNFRSGIYAYEAMSLIIKVAFTRLNLRLIKSVFYEENEPTRLMHKKLNFTECGRIENHLWNGKNYSNSIIASLQKKDWMSR